MRSNSMSRTPLLPESGGVRVTSHSHQLMPRCLAPFLLVLGLSVLALLLLVNSRYSAVPTLGEALLQGRTIQSWSNVDEAEGAEELAEEMLQVLEEQRHNIAEEMQGYIYPKGRHNVNASSLADLVPELGGQPLRSVIITSWRSGSTFLGDVLNSHPGNWYHYEPLLELDIVQVRGPPLADPSLNQLDQLLNCNYTGLDNYLEFGKKHVFLFTHNRRLWTQCEAHPTLCWNQDFLTQMCRLFPAQSMKLVRLRLQLAERLLQDQGLNVRMVYLVRDPRGTMQSRKHRDWCPNNPDCSNPKLLCSDLASDYYSAVRIAKKYPQQFRVVRYEDLSVEPYRGVRELLHFYGLNFHPAVRLFLDTHTKVDVGGVSSTFRDSKAAPFHWRRDLGHMEVRHIQAVCTEAMQLWGYLPAVNSTHQRDFNPLTTYRLH